MPKLIKLEGRIQSFDNFYSSNAVSIQSKYNIVFTPEHFKTFTIQKKSKFQRSSLYSSAHTKQFTLIEIDDRYCIAEFDDDIFIEDEYLVCLVEEIDPNIRKVHAILKPETGKILVHNTVKLKIEETKSVQKRKSKRYYGFGLVISLILIFAVMGLINNSFLVIAVLIAFYFAFFYKVDRREQNPKGKISNIYQVLDKFGFVNSSENNTIVYQLTEHSHEYQNYTSIDYREFITEDPYPENYVKDK